MNIKMIMSSIKGLYCVLFFFSTILFSCINKNDTTAGDYTNAAQADSIRLLLKRIDTVQKINDSLRIAAEFLFDETDIDELKLDGLKNPYNQLHDDLSKRKDLMPEAVLGGTMTLENLTLIRSKWAVATYSDGHIIVTNLLKYRIANGIIKWQIVDSYN